MEPCMLIRTAALPDLEEAVYIEDLIFPGNMEAARAMIKERLEVYPEHYWLLLDDACEPPKVIGMIDGFVTDIPDLEDRMFDHPEMHDENGAWQMLFGLEVLPEYRKQGCAAMLVNHVIECARNQGRKGIVLTCEEHLIHYYERFGFKNEGISPSKLIGKIWYQMRYTF